jgi:hypothetical protein
VTRQELISDIIDEVTFSGSLPYQLPTKEVERVIKNAEVFFYDNWQYALDKAYLQIPVDVFSAGQFKDSRTITLPDCVQFVHKAVEPTGASVFSTMDRDFGENKFVGSEMYLTPFVGESLMYRTVMFSFLDLTRAFLLDTIAYDYNKNTKQLTVLGRTPKRGAVLEVAKKIDSSNLYEDEMFQRYCRAKSKQRLGEMITTFDYVLPGDVKINYTNLVTKADAEMTAVMEAIKGENSAGWMYTMRF